MKIMEFKDFEDIVESYNWLSKERVLITFKNKEVWTYKYNKLKKILTKEAY